MSGADDLRQSAGAVGSPAAGPGAADRKDAPTRRWLVVLARVLAVQILALAILWFLQARYAW